MTLHDQEVRVINIEFNTTEQCFDCFLGDFLAVDVAFHLVVLDRTSDVDLFVILVALRGLLFNRVIEFDCDRSFGDACIPSFVNKLLDLFYPDQRHPGNTF